VGPEPVWTLWSRDKSFIPAGKRILTVQFAIPIELSGLVFLSVCPTRIRFYRVQYSRGRLVSLQSTSLGSADD
jgi:hypothetical protein